MSGHHTDIVPGERWLFAGIGLLFMISLSAVLFGLTTGAGQRVDPLPAFAQKRLLIFEDGRDGAVDVLDAATGEVVAGYASGEGAFARTALRSLAYSRRLHGVADEEPFLLGRAEDGQIILHDPATLETIGVNAFGASNIAQFAFLLGEESGS